MVRVLTVDDVRTLIRKVTIKTFFLRLRDRLEEDFRRWQQFQKSARLAAHVPGGVIELMPIYDEDYYSYKFVNGHPNNPLQRKQTVVALGTLADVHTGYPVLISEMTLLTAFRTAATSALASQYLASKTARTFGIIGTGAQGEFQVLAHAAVFDLAVIYYFDIDPSAMQKFAKNLAFLPVRLVPCSSSDEVVALSDIVTTATASKQQARIINAAQVKPGLHINGIGGDCPGKTELDPAILACAKTVVEYWPQTQLEGESQQQTTQFRPYAELWELASCQKPGRESDSEVTVFDSVGFALEDYSVLRLVYHLAESFHIGHVMDMVPEPEDPKNLFGVLSDVSWPML